MPIKKLDFSVNLSTVPCRGTSAQWRREYILKKGKTVTESFYLEKNQLSIYEY